MSEVIRDMLRSSVVCSDAMYLLLGKQIGRGAFRTVFECPMMPDVVIKVESASHSFANIREWEMWDEVQHYKPTAKWLAPCLHISQCGLFLVMKKAEPIATHHLPKRVPHWFSDMKPDNFGWIDGKLVCIDYGTVPISGVMGGKERTKKAEWRT